MSDEISYNIHPSKKSVRFLLVPFLDICDKRVQWLKRLYWNEQCKNDIKWYMYTYKSLPTKVSSSSLSDDSSGSFVFRDI